MEATEGSYDELEEHYSSMIDGSGMVESRAEGAITITTQVETFVLDEPTKTRNKGDLGYRKCCHLLYLNKLSIVNSCYYLEGLVDFLFGT